MTMKTNKTIGCGLVAAWTAFGAAFAASGAEGFRFERDGLVTPRGTVAWGDMLEVRSYERPTQKYRTYGVTAKVRVFTATRVELDFTEKESGAYVPLRLDLDDTYLRARVDAGDIVEPLGCSYRVMELAILPTVMDAKVGEEGRYLLPIYGGCIAPFRADRRLFTRDRIYVQQNTWEKMGMINAFGASRSGDSTLGIVHGGDFSAWVETTVDPGTGVCRQSPVVRVREDPADVQSFERKEILFRNLKGAKDWTGLALAYGEYLRTERELLPIEVRAAGNERLQYILGAVRVNIFMGLKKPFVPDGSSPYFSATTFAEAEEIVDEVRARGIDKAWFCLVGWIKDGHDGAYPSHFPVNAQAGGEEGLKRLIAKIRGYGYAVTPHDNIHSCYAASPDYDSQIPCRTRAGEELPMGIWSGGMIRIGCPHLYVQRYGGDFARIKGLGFAGVYYIDALMPVLFQCHDPRHPADERQFIEGQLRVLQWMKSEYGVAATETQAMPALKYIDYGSNGGSGDRVYFSRLLDPDTKAMFERYVPFYNVAMHGLIVYQSGWVHAFRKKGKWLSAIVDGGVPAVETAMRNGANGDYYRDSLDDMMAWWEICFKVAPEFSRGVTTAFEEFAPDAVHWTFHNGLEMWVNATDEAAGGLKPRTIRLTRHGQEIYTGSCAR